MLLIFSSLRKASRTQFGMQTPKRMRFRPTGRGQKLPRPALCRPGPGHGCHCKHINTKSIPLTDSLLSAGNFNTRPGPIRPSAAGSQRSRDCVKLQDGSHCRRNRPRSNQGRNAGTGRSA